MKHWRFKAFDAKLRVHEGIVGGAHLGEAALTIRKAGLQMIELNAATPAERRFILKAAQAAKKRLAIEPMIMKAAPISINRRRTTISKTAFCICAALIALAMAYFHWGVK